LQFAINEFLSTVDNDIASLLSGQLKGRPDQVLAAIRERIISTGNHIMQRGGTQKHLGRVRLTTSADDFNQSLHRWLNTADDEMGRLRQMFYDDLAGQGMSLDDYLNALNRNNVDDFYNGLGGLDDLQNLAYLDRLLRDYRRINEGSQFYIQRNHLIEADDIARFPHAQKALGNLNNTVGDVMIPYLIGSRGLANTYEEMEMGGRYPAAFYYAVQRGYRPNGFGAYGAMGAPYGSQYGGYNQYYNPGYAQQFSPYNPNQPYSVHTPFSAGPQPGQVPRPFLGPSHGMSIDQQMAMFDSGFNQRMRQAGIMGMQPGGMQGMQPGGMQGMQMGGSPFMAQNGQYSY